MAATPDPSDASAPGGASAPAGARPSWSPALKRVTVAALGVLGLFGLLALATDPLIRMAAATVSFEVSAADDAELPPLAQPSTIVAADGTRLARVLAVDRELVSIDELPRHTLEAAIAGEDRRFLQHNGYDVSGIGRALLANLRARGVVQGGSTITQQVARRNFLDNQQTLRRKAQEIVYATALEEEFTKEEILERYLNEAYFGSGAYGIQSAAQEFFRVDASDLSVGQSALLIGILRAPSALDPRENVEAAQLRRDSVLAAMAEERYLSDRRAADVAEQPVEVAEPRATDDVLEPFVVEAVKRAFLANPAFGETVAEREDLLRTGGLTVRTTVDLELQEAAREVVDDVYDGDGPTAAVVAIDPRDGTVQAMYARADFAETQFDVVTQGRRQPGSAFKPFVLATALEEGVSMERELEGDSPTTFEDVDDWDEDGEGVRNFEDVDHGSPTVREALVHSVNTAFAELVLDVGPADVADLAARLGIDADEAIGPDPGPAIALGGLGGGVTPLEMASAYGAMTNGGIFVPPSLVATVEGPDGQVLYEARSEGELRMEPAAAASTTATMQEVVRRGTGTAAQLSGWEPAGKTGTTQDNADAWFVGAVPVLSTAVWVGHPEGRVSMPGVTGGEVPAPLWAEFMERALDDREPVDFPDPDEAGGDLADG